MAWLFPSHSYDYGYDRRLGEPFGYARSLFDRELNSDDYYQDNYRRQPRTRAEHCTQRRTNARAKANAQAYGKEKYAQALAQERRAAYYPDQRQRRQRQRHRTNEHEVKELERLRRLQRRQQQQERIQQAYIEQLYARKQQHELQEQRKAKDQWLQVQRQAEPQGQQDDCEWMQNTQDISYHEHGTPKRSIKRPCYQKQDREHKSKPCRTETHFDGNVMLQAYAIATSSGDDIWIEVVDETPCIPDSQKMPDDSLHILEPISSVQH